MSNQTEFQATAASPSEVSIATGPFEPSWQSLQGYEIPEWYKDAKFGIFIHWGVYAVPAFGSEWYPRNMYQQGSKEFAHHLETYGPHKEFGYKDFVPMFKAESFDAGEWADLFVEAGAKFVMPVAEHHDGFAMYDTKYTRWNAKNMGPKRDVLGELSAAFKERGLIFTLSNHRAENYFFYDGGKEFDSDVQDPENVDLYGLGLKNHDHHDFKGCPPTDAVLANWLERNIELVDKYRPNIVWFDWWIEQEKYAPVLQQFAAHYYNRAKEWGVEVAINYKREAFASGTAVFDIERGQLNGIREEFWQTDTAVAKNSWSYTVGNDYKTAASLIHDLIDIVSKNGALLLNIGPRADGIIPEEDAQILRAIGNWLKVNGEAIFETRPYKVYGEGPTQIPEGTFSDDKKPPFTGADVRFTTKGDTFYATLLGWPEDGKIVIESLGLDSGFGDVTSVELLGSETAPVWEQTAAGLEVTLPESVNRGEAAFVLRVLR